MCALPQYVKSKSETRPKRVCIRQVAYIISGTAYRIDFCFHRPPSQIILALCVHYDSDRKHPGGFIHGQAAHIHFCPTPHDCLVGPHQSATLLALLLAKCDSRHLKVETIRLH